MGVGVFDCQPFGACRGIEVTVGRNQHERAGTSRLTEAVDFKSYGELHRIVGAKRMFDPQPHGIVQQGGRHLGDGIPPGEVLAKAVENRRCALRRDGSSFVTARDGSRDLRRRIRLSPANLRPGIAGVGSTLLSWHFTRRVRTGLVLMGPSVIINTQSGQWALQGAGRRIAGLLRVGRLKIHIGGGRGTIVLCGQGHAVTDAFCRL